MIFNHFAFLFVFLPAVIAGFLMAPPRVRESFLLGASLLFYGLAGAEHVIVLLLCAAWVWVFTARTAAVGGRLTLTLAVAGPLATLFFYKYLGFVVRDILGVVPVSGGWLADATDKLLPAGISFFTFHLVAFAFDRYHGIIPHQPRLQHFLLYIAFFPHLVAGPILRYGEVANALAQVKTARPAEEDWRRAIGFFCCGLAAKVLLADSLSGFVQPLTQSAGSLSSLQAVYVILAYSFQIYFDFWGYSLMAIGLAIVFGFTFPHNFDRPYSALNPRDFWRRWHMTLGRWFRDYLYIPLGGNRRYGRTMLIVFAVCGLWHGAAWQFLVWGIYHGLLVVFYHLIREPWDRLPRPVQAGMTFGLVSLGWMLFLFDMETATAFFGSLLSGSPTGPGLGAEAWVMLAVAAGACYGLDVERLLAPRDGGRLAQVVTSAGFAALFTLAVLHIDRSNSFIYFRF